MTTSEQRKRNRTQKAIRVHQVRLMSSPYTWQESSWPADHAFPYRTHEEDRQVAASAQRADPQLFPRPKAALQRVVEGLNNKAKVTMRKSYGFRTFRVLELALYHSLGKLPEPESTHDFF